MGKITYQTLRENVVDAIRMKILDHELEPGSRIIEQDISDELGVSRGPIREALRQLEQEGLVEYTRNVGCSVKQVTLEDIYEIYLLRATYETLAVKLCNGKFSEAALAEMAKVLELMKGLTGCDFITSVECDNRLHEIIVCSTGLPRLIKSWRDLNYGNMINFYAGSPDSKAMSARQYPIHKELFDACCTGDTEVICKAVSDHYMRTIRRRLQEEGLSEDHFRFSIDVIAE